LTILDENATILDLKEHLMEFKIDHDPSYSIPKMIMQNVTANPTDETFFHYHLIDLSHLNEELTYSIYLEFSPEMYNLSYVLVYQFDHLSVSTHSTEQVKHWTRFCSTTRQQLSPDAYLIHNFARSEHRTIIFGIRQLTVFETDQFCFDNKSSPDRFNQPVVFTSDYSLRLC
jgi:hypothetical protein